MFSIRSGIWKPSLKDFARDQYPETWLHVMYHHHTCNKNWTTLLFQETLKIKTIATNFKQRFKTISNLDLFNSLLISPDNHTVYWSGWSISEDDGWSQYQKCYSGCSWSWLWCYFDDFGKSTFHFCKIDALKSFLKFTGKNLCQSLFFNTFTADDELTRREIPHFKLPWTKWHPPCVHRVKFRSCTQNAKLFLLLFYQL